MKETRGMVGFGIRNFPATLAGLSRTATTDALILKGRDYSSSGFPSSSPSVGRVRGPPASQTA